MTHKAEPRPRGTREVGVRRKVRRLARHLVEEDPLDAVAGRPAGVRVDVTEDSALLGSSASRRGHVAEHDDVRLVEQLWEALLILWPWLGVGTTWAACRIDDGPERDGRVGIDAVSRFSTKLEYHMDPNDGPSRIEEGRPAGAGWPADGVDVEWNQ